MKILVTGSRGQLGSELRIVLEQRVPGITTYIDKDELDLTDVIAVEQFLRAGGFSHVINCAAYTAVDLAEEEKLQCSAVNIDAVGNIARFADELDMRIVHISTDYVFDGTAHTPYVESDKPNPMSQYGATKRKGETALLGLAPQSIVVRTGWLYSPFGKNFVKTMVDLASQGKKLRVVVDQIGTPTYAADLAEAIAAIVLQGPWTPGIFHYSNEGAASWYDLAVAAIEAAGMAEQAKLVEPISTADYPTAAMRPPYAILSKTKIKATFGLHIPHWYSSLRRCVSRLQSSKI